MKKLIALVLTLTLALSATAFAATLNDTGSDSAEVKATYTAGQKADTVYSVDISWESLSFTYHGQTDGTWDATEHKYTGTIEAGWNEGTGTITVTNHSNTAITVTPSYTANKGYEAVGMTFTGLTEDKLTVENADAGVGKTGAAKTGTITVTPNGTLPENTAADTVIGTITVTIE